MVRELVERVIRVDQASVSGTTMDYDLVHLTTPDVILIWNSVNYRSLASFQTATGKEMHGVDADPQWKTAAAGDFHLTAGSPLKDIGDNSVIRTGETDVDLEPRLMGTSVDIGADEITVPYTMADALSALCSGAIARDPDPDRATVIVHASLEGLLGGSGCELEGGPVIHPSTASRLLCDARIQTVIEDQGGRVLGVGRLHRDPPAWMIRQLRYRDRECRFPGCGSRRFTQAHHIVW